MACGASGELAISCVGKHTNIENCSGSYQLFDLRLAWQCGSRNTHQAERSTLRVIRGPSKQVPCAPGEVGYLLLLANLVEGEGGVRLRLGFLEGGVALAIEAGVVLLEVHVRVVLGCRNSMGRHVMSDLKVCGPQHTMR